jgi:NAD(P)-dependent dehydrogenase (short-subunit alcohol dehydrogenase family)
VRCAKPAQIILLGRDEARVNPIISKIHALSPRTKTWFHSIDMSSSRSIHEAAKYVLASPEIKTIDVLINNAGVMACPYTPVEEWKDENGSPVELQFATNYLGHFLLTMLLMDRLRQSGQGARVVNLSAASHRSSGVRFDDLNFSVSEVLGHSLLK